MKLVVEKQRGGRWKKRVEERKRRKKREEGKRTEIERTFIVLFHPTSLCECRTRKMLTEVLKGR